jgi:hypothetical protein
LREVCYPPLRDKMTKIIIGHRPQCQANLKLLWANKNPLLETLFNNRLTQIGNEVNTKCQFVAILLWIGQMPCLTVRIVTDWDITFDTGVHCPVACRFRAFCVVGGVNRQFLKRFTLASFRPSLFGWIADLTAAVTIQFTLCVPLISSFAHYFSIRIGTSFEMPCWSLL